MISKNSGFGAPAFIMSQSRRFTPRLSPFNSKRILLKFDGAEMSSDAALVLLPKIDDKTDLA